MTRSDLPVHAPQPQRVDPLPNWSDAQIAAEAASLGAEIPPGSVSRLELIGLLERQRHLVASLDESVLTEIVQWAHLPLPPIPPGDAGTGLSARKERLARAVVSLKTMRFAGLSRDALQTLAILRGIPIQGDEPVPVLVSVLKSQETLGAKSQRKGRSLLGSLAEKFIGAPPSSAPPNAKSLKHQIEDQGLLAGLSNRLKRSADSYVTEKLDEIEARIDRKLDEIDRRLCDWRDKEIANRIRIIKITLWASVVISALSLLYTYLRVHF